MLKWTVNGPRQSYLPPLSDNGDVYKLPTTKHARRSLNVLENCGGVNIPSTSTPAERRWMKRKSCDLNTLRPRLQPVGKENQMTSTPLHAIARNNTKHMPLPKLDSLQDLSNIAADVTVYHNVDVNKTPTPKLPKSYATTLPTFDVEYSPCGLIPGPLLALRGMGIVDSYFEKPRYITPQEPAPTTKKANIEVAQTTLQAAALKAQANCEDDYSLSSSKMGDVTLEQMIDAILQSTRKERKPMKSAKAYAAQRARPDMSPTYTAADDPANDLPEYWTTQPSTVKPTPRHLTFNEREVCSPRHSLVQQSNILKLRRQRAVRRKRKISEKFTASVRNSAQKLFNVGTPAAQASCNYHRLIDRSQLEQSDTQNESISSNSSSQVDAHNLSPDSGHNSSNELEEETILESSKYLHDDEAKILDGTKRRLSFSTKT